MNTEVRTRLRAKVTDQDSRSARGADLGPAARPREAGRGREQAAEGQPVAARASGRTETGLGQRAAAPGRRPVPGRTGPAGRTAPARPAGPGRLPGPDRLARPETLTGPDRLAGPAPQAAGGPTASLARPVARTPFILLVLGLLGGGLICLLVINTTLATGSFRITHLQQANVALAQQEQALQQQVASEQSPANIEKQALQLGMRQQQLLNFIKVRTGHIYRQPATEAGVTAVPGYTP
jgi:hypothetical protein